MVSAFSTLFLKNLSLFQSLEDVFLHYIPKSWLFCFAHLGLRLTWKRFLCMVWGRDKILFFFMCFYIFNWSNVIYWKTTFHPLFCSVICVTHQVTMYVWLYSWNLSSLPLIFLFILSLLSHRFSYYRLLLHLNSQQRKSYHLILLL